MKNTFKQVFDQEKKDKRAFLIGEIKASLILTPVFIFFAWFSMATLADVILVPAAPSAFTKKVYHNSSYPYIVSTQDCVIASLSWQGADCFVEVAR